MNPTEKDVRKNWNNRSWWIEISTYSQLSEEFIKKYKDKLDWNRISTFQKLSEEFMDKHSYYINWSFISAYQELSEEFIKRNKNKVDWDNISLCQVLSEKFIWDNIKLVEPDYIAESQILSKEFLSKHGDIFNWNILSEHQPFISNCKEAKLYKNYERNLLGKEYEKNNLWFIGYLYHTEYYYERGGINLNIFTLKPKETVIYGASIEKHKIYWEDLILTNRVKKSEKIRTIKII